MKLKTINDAIAALKAFDDEVLTLQFETLHNVSDANPAVRAALNQIADNNANTVMLLAAFRNNDVCAHELVALRLEILRNHEVAA